MRHWTSIGFVIGLLLTALVAIVHGSGYIQNLQITVWRAGAFYVAGGVLTGAIIGLLRPWTDTLIGRVIVGMIVAAPIAVLGRITLYGLTPLRDADIAMFLVFCLGCGPLYAAATWDGSK